MQPRPVTQLPKNNSCDKNKLADDRNCARLYSSLAQFDYSSAAGPTISYTGGYAMAGGGGPVPKGTFKIVRYVSLNKAKLKQLG